LAVSDNLRIEGEVGYRNAGFGDRGDISNTTLMLNALFDIPVTESLSFAGGGGLGIDWIATDLSSDAADNASVFAYQAIAEASIELTDRIDLTLTYRYLDASGADDLYAEVAMRGAAPGSTAAVRIDDVSTSTVSVGLRFAL
jgi:opacity protein-like surface antigen